MPDIKVTFVHPTDGRNVSVALDDTITAGDAINELINAEFILSSPAGYCLGKKGGDRLSNDGELAASGVKDGDMLNVIPNTDAGSPM